MLYKNISLKGVIFRTSSTLRLVVSNVTLNSIFSISMASSVCCRLRGGSSSGGMPSDPALAVSSVSGQHRPSVVSNWFPVTYSTHDRKLSSYAYIFICLDFITYYRLLDSGFTAYTGNQLPSRLMPWSSWTSCALMSTLRAVSRKVRRKSKKRTWTKRSEAGSLSVITVYLLFPLQSKVTNLKTFSPKCIISTVKNQKLPLNAWLDSLSSYIFILFHGKVLVQLLWDELKYYFRAVKYTTLNRECSKWD